MFFLLACVSDDPKNLSDSTHSITDDSALDSVVDTAPDSETTTSVPPDIDRTLATYINGPRLSDSIALDDGSFIVVGQADNLDWATNVRMLDGQAIQGQPGGETYAVILHFSADLQSLLDVRSLPAGASTGFVRAVARGGSLYISGTTLANKDAGTGAFIARMSVEGESFDWVNNYWVAGDQQSHQPWDVAGDGTVTYAVGEGFAYDWVALYRLGADGQRIPVENWRTHWTSNSEEHFSPISSRSDLDVLYSGVVLKTWGRCELRSWTDAEYRAATSDGNGGTRQGTWPMDLFFDGPCDPTNPTTEGPGYTGYSMGANPTQEVGAIATDPATGITYVGISTQSTLPDGNPDFEPAVLAFAADGTLLWWSRLYTENNENSSPDQFVDALTVSHGQLYVVARAHGNNTTNLWDGNHVAATGASRSFQTRFTGSEGNIHISWIGRFEAATGTLMAATWLAEYPDGMAGTGAAYVDPNLDGWPDHDSAWADLNTTRVSDLAVDTEGRVWVSAIGRRSITTANAYQKMPKLEEGVSAWTWFVRAYTPELDNVVYSSLIGSTWDLNTGEGGEAVELTAIVPTVSGVLAVGGSTEGSAAMPVRDVPAWGSETPAMGVVAHLQR